MLVLFNILDNRIQYAEVVSRGVQASPLFDHQGGARHPPELFSPIFSDLVRGDHALGI